MQQDCLIVLFGSKLAHDHHLVSHDEEFKNAGLSVWKYITT
jgi:hypothetical protein